MHGLRDLNGKKDTPERAQQARKLLALSNQVSETDGLDVICGDFNVEPESETLRILRQSDFVELVTSHGFKSTRNSYYKKPGKFADYMLVSKPDMVRAFDVIYDPEISDHCPLLLEI